jgi:hypothetical protein
MLKILSSVITVFATRRLKAVTLIYVALAAVHVSAAYFYLMQGSVPHAICAALASILYVLLAHLRGLSH